MIRGGLGTSEAAAFIKAMPTVEQLLPPVDVAALPTPKVAADVDEVADYYRRRGGGWEPPIDAAGQLLTPTTASGREAKRQALAAALASNPSASEPSDRQGCRGRSPHGGEGACGNQVGNPRGVPQRTRPTDEAGRDSHRRRGVPAASQGRTTDGLAGGLCANPDHAAAGCHPRAGHGQYKYHREGVPPLVRIGPMLSRPRQHRARRRGSSPRRTPGRTPNRADRRQSRRKCPLTWSFTPSINADIFLPQDASSRLPSRNQPPFPARMRRGGDGPARPGTDGSPTTWLPHRRGERSRARQPRRRLTGLVFPPAQDARSIVGPAAALPSR